jgi:GalNAc-alpha-(1->4)-GalNAc-alpha-(1->3)-diNAcBac-PP-undecaprenol alpha-1,4-N-acetyl-D-galactosaminyltransferase
MERVMSELSGYFCLKEEVDVHLVLFGRNPEIFYHVPSNLAIHRPESEFNNKFRLISSVKRMIFLRHTIKEIKPNFILSFGEYWNSFVMLALLGLNCPIFLSDRCRPDKYLGFFHQNLRRVLYRFATGIIVQTEKAKEIYETFLHHSCIKIIGNPIREIKTDDITIKENVVLTIGRLIPSKNHMNLIDSFVRINTKDWKLIIVGGNALNMNLMKDIKDRVSKLGMENSIILAGNCADVDSFYRKSKVFVMMSDSEGFPNVIGEAMSSGLPVVAFDCIAGPSEMITDGKDGFLIPLYDYEMFEMRLVSLINEPDLRERLGLEARNSIRNFAIDRIGEDYYSFISSVN